MTTIISLIMKYFKLLTSLLLLLTFISSWTLNNQITEKPKPRIYQIGSARITVWTNFKKDSTTWKNYVDEKVYSKDGELKTTNSFNEYELEDLQKAIEKAILSEKDK